MSRVNTGVAIRINCLWWIIYRTAISHVHFGRLNPGEKFIPRQWILSLENLEHGQNYAKDYIIYHETNGIQSILLTVDSVCGSLSYSIPGQINFVTHKWVGKHIWNLVCHQSSDQMNDQMPNITTVASTVGMFALWAARLPELIFYTRECVCGKNPQKHIHTYVYSVVLDGEQ